MKDPPQVVHVMSMMVVLTDEVKSSIFEKPLPTVCLPQHPNTLIYLKKNSPKYSMDIDTNKTYDMTEKPCNHLK